MKLKNIIIKTKDYLIKSKNRLQLKNKNFTIISNNCWGGFVYQMFGLKYTSPTIGLFFIGDDYIKFCERLEYYTSIELKFIPFNESKNFQLINNSSAYPIGVLDDIEIYFLHYESEFEAKQKWEKRCRRINFENILFKISQREGYTKENIENFMNMNKKNKIAFSYDVVDGAIIVPELETLKGDEMPIITDLINYSEVLNSMMQEL